MKPVYLDYAATTPVDARVLKAMLPYFCEQYGNPSSLYSFGREARQAVSQARRQLASLLGAEPDEIFFTSGGSESDNWVIRSLSEEALRHGGGHIITTKVEHHAVLRACEALPSGIEVTYLDVDSEGRVQPEAVESSLRPDTFLVSVMAANNEVGTIEPIAEIGAICRAYGVFFHTDAVQAVGHIPVSVKEWQVDALSLSGHKLYGPKGIGALYVKKGLRLPPLTFGGGQEKGMRPGTEAIPNIAAFAKACEIRMAHFDEDYAHVQELADYLRQQVAAELPNAVINGEGDIPHVVNLSVPGCKSEVMLHVLEGDEVYISSGSACSKGKQSGVLKALGLPKARTDSALRVSFAPFNTREDVDAFINAVKKGAKMFRR